MPDELDELDADLVDPRTSGEREEDAREWGELLLELYGRTAWDIIEEDEREADWDPYAEQREVEAAARWYFGY